MIKVYSLTRVEPVSRGGDPGRGLAATVQDPFWMLARQRQFGELTGEDAGSPRLDASALVRAFAFGIGADEFHEGAVGGIEFGEERDRVAFGDFF